MDQVTRLLTACEQGHDDTVTQILDEGVDVDIEDETGVTALQVASANGHEGLVRLLLMRGAALERANAAGWTALLHASRHAHTAVVACLLQNRANVHARTRLGVGAAELAARGGHLATCACLADAGAQLAPTGGEFVPLMAAAHHGHDAIVRFILDRGADVNYQTPCTRVTPLMLTALNDHMTTAQVLIERNADPNLTNEANQSALDIAIECDKREVLGYLDRKTIKRKRHVAVDVKADIIEAVKQGDVQRICEVLEGDILQRDTCSPHDGATPLMFAAMTGRLDIAELLVSSGCDVNKQDVVSGWTALMQATYHGNSSVAKFLLNAGADVLLPAKNGCTAFDMASLIDGVDTDLFRMMASKAVETSESQRRFPCRPVSNGLATSIANDNERLNEELTMNGLKAWWSRMSNRFRNLKLGRTFNLGTNRLSPLPAEGAAIDGTLRPILHVQHALSGSETWSGRVTGLPPGDTSGSPRSHNVNLITGTPHVFTPGGEMRPITHPRLPTFVPPPTFDPDRSRMPPTGQHRGLSFVSLRSSSTLTHARPLVPPVKLLQSYVSHKLATGPAPTRRGGRPRRGVTSARGAESPRVRPTSSVESTLSSATSSTLTDVGVASDVEVSTARSQSTAAERPTSLSTHGAPQRMSHSSGGSPSSYDNYSPSAHSHRKDSSRDSNSTLTPSPTAKTTAADPSGSEDFLTSPSKTRADQQDDLHLILKKLSLERYQPIFEEQEVDMEAFLTLTEGDLHELGISQSDAILAAITQLNSGKGRERQNFHEYMTQFETIRSRSSGSGNAASHSWSDNALKSPDG